MPLLLRTALVELPVRLVQVAVKRLTLIVVETLTPLGLIRTAVRARLARLLRTLSG